MHVRQRTSACSRAATRGWRQRQARIYGLKVKSKSIFVDPATVAANIVCTSHSGLLTCFSIDAASIRTLAGAILPGQILACGDFRRPLRDSKRNKTRHDHEDVCVRLNLSPLQSAGTCIRAPAMDAHVTTIDVLSADDLRNIFAFVPPFDRCDLLRIAAAPRPLLRLNTHHGTTPQPACWAPCVCARTVLGFVPISPCKNPL